MVTPTFTSSPICQKAWQTPKKIAELYRGRWTIETAFQYLTEYYNSEISTLGYPRAALFAFCIALVCYITMSVMKAAIGSVHGIDVVENQISGYYVANEISAIYPGMMIAIDDAHWAVFRNMPATLLSKTLVELASNIRLSAFQKHPRGPKKPQTEAEKLQEHSTCLNSENPRWQEKVRVTLKGLVLMTSCP